MMMRALVLAALLCAAAATCPAGYEDIDSVCTDIDECQLGTTNCNVCHPPRFALGVCLHRGPVSVTVARPPI
jgi:hypothetical protein